MGRFTKSLFLCALVVAIVVLIGFWSGKYQRSAALNGGLARSSQEQGKTTDINATVQRLLNEKVKAFYQWKIDTDTTLLCIARDSGKREFPGEPTTDIFSIMDGQGKLLYQIDHVEIDNISSSYMLRVARPQLVVGVDEGGRMASLKILDYQNGKITELLDEDDQDYLVSAIKPQFRSGVIPAQEPYEILMIRGGGLANSDEKKYVSVYRYADGVFEFNGDVSQQLLDDYMERLLKKKTR